DAADELVVKRLVLAVPEWPQDVEEAGDDQHPEEGWDDCPDQRADVPERPALVAVESDRRARGHLSDRLPAFGVADGVVKCRAGEVDEIRERAQEAREGPTPRGEDRQSEDERSNSEADEQRIDDRRAHALAVLRVPEGLDGVSGGGGHAGVRLRWRGSVHRRRCVSRKAVVRCQASSLAALSYSGRDGSSNQFFVFA